MLLPTLLPLLSLLPFAIAQGYVHHITGINKLTTAGFLVRPTASDSANVAFFTSPTGAGCGTTPTGAAIDTAIELDKAAAAGLPMAGRNGTVAMVWREVGTDGVGPVTVEWDPTGTGLNFTPITVLVNVGDTGAGSDQILTAQLPEHTNCTGGAMDNACLLRVLAGDGKSGSCLAVRSYNTESLASSKISDNISSNNSDADDGEEDDSTPTPTAPNARPSPSKIVSGGASMPSGLRRARAPKHAQVKRRKSKHSVRAEPLKGRGGSAWSRVKRRRSESSTGL
ncbi:hypothetical protein CALCODRAFT_502665 [Calocera cornea HHB12733]|uniref:Lytic polysaccharide monooxygenase n=1 Tax=Calocera cornea HHB12733 TaxID=1353952 RepID=A0A165D5W6_9BASI|nr:hypothetical protein CALCODRAFT_502665 [Calocera cornea HHB12733]